MKETVNEKFIYVSLVELEQHEVLEVLITYFNQDL